MIAPATSPPATTTPAALGPAEDRILRALARYHYLTNAQVCRLFYRPGSWAFVCTKTKRLVDTGYCERSFLDRTSQHGSAPSYFWLAAQGRRYVQAQGIAVKPRYRPSEHLRWYPQLAHALAVSDVLIAAERWSRAHPHLELAEVRHDLTLQREPVRVTITDPQHPQREAQVNVVPDGWLDWRDGDDRLCVALEVDRHTEASRQWRCKIRALLAYAGGPYQTAFDTTSLTIAVVAARGGKARREQLQAWTEAELTALGQEDQADLFRFTHLDAARVPPRVLFEAPAWSRPFADQPVPLLSDRA